jgi:hypothetical protein
MQGIKCWNDEDITDNLSEIFYYERKDEWYLVIDMLYYHSSASN